MPHQILEIVEGSNLNTAETKEHLCRVRFMMERLVETHNDRMGLQLKKQHIKRIVEASALHDIGKVAIPADILSKPGSLDQTERIVVETHPLAGYYVFKKIMDQQKLPYNKRERKVAENIILFHHEKWNGGGYPKGLKEREIPLEARLVAVIDVFDALISQRSYKEAWSVADAVAFIASKSGECFDPEIVDSFVSIGEQIAEVSGC